MYLHHGIHRGLIQKEVNSSNDVLHLMMQAVQSRKIGETKMNKQSSRSHCIFTVNVQVSIKDNEGMVQYLGRLHMVDLAGSECAKHASLESRQSVVSNYHYIVEYVYFLCKISLCPHVNQ